METYGRLKMELIRRGLYLSEEVRACPEVSLGICSGNPGEEISLALAEDFIVKVVIKPRAEGSLELLADERGLRLKGPQGESEVAVIPLPMFIKSQMMERTPLSENVCLDGYCLNIFLRVMGGGQRLNLSQEAVLSIVQSAFEEGSADLVQLNMDYCEERDRGFRLVAPVVEAIKKKFQTFVALKGFPPEEKQVMDRMYAAGLDLVNFPFGGYAGSVQSGDLVSSDQVSEALEYAVGIFSQGTVWTELVPGRDPLEDIRARIDRLTGRGIVPLLKLEPASITVGDAFPKVEDAVRALEQAAQRDRLPLKWLYPNCRSVSPLDTKFYTGEKKSAQLSAKPVYRSILGKKASEGFAALRRKLRIRDVSDSYESAGL